MISFYWTKNVNLCFVSGGDTNSGGTSINILEAGKKIFRNARKACKTNWKKKEHWKLSFRVLFKDKCREGACFVVELLAYYTSTVSKMEENSYGSIISPTIRLR